MGSESLNWGISSLGQHRSVSAAEFGDRPPYLAELARRRRPQHRSRRTPELHRSPPTAIRKKFFTGGPRPAARETVLKGLANLGFSAELTPMPIARAPRPAALQRFWVLARISHTIFA